MPRRLTPRGMDLIGPRPRSRGSSARLGVTLSDLRISAMSRRCDLTGKGPQVGHKVSHSNLRTRRLFLPTLLTVTLTSNALDRSVKLRVSGNALKTERASASEIS